MSLNREEQWNTETAEETDRNGLPEIVDVYSEGCREEDRSFSGEENIPDGQKLAAEEKKKKNIKREIFEWVRMIVIVIVVVVVLLRFVVINARVPSGSMENTIMTSDRLIGFRFSYWFGEPERGDIILFKYPVDTEQTYIKRVIGLPGETVEIKDGNIYIDGSEEPLDESDYLKEEWVIENDGYVFEVPEDCYLVLGDNRNYSLDARYWAQEAVDAGAAVTEEGAESYRYVPKSYIKGKAIFKYYSSFALLTDTAGYE